MVIDASALVAIALDEPERASFAQAIASDPVRLVSAPTLLEASMVLMSRRTDGAAKELRAFVDRAGITIAPFTAEQLDLAVEAFRRFGEGRHPAGLNFGDCISYALAKATGEPLLCKGDDFPLSDVVRVI